MKGEIMIRTKKSPKRKHAKRNKTWGVIKFWKVDAPDVDTVMSKINDHNCVRTYTIVVK